MTDNLYAPPKSTLSDSPGGEPAPPLWNPNAAALWSLVFSPAFGAYIHMKNWESLGDSVNALAARNWMITTLVVVVGVSVTALFLPAQQAVQSASNLLGLLLLFSWYYSSGKAQILFVKSRYGKVYPRKKWGTPLLVACVALFGYVVLIMAAAVVSSSLTRPSISS